MAEIPDELAELLGKDPAEMEVGEVARIPIRRSETYSFGVADQVTVNSIVGGTVDLVAVANNQVAMYQAMTVNATAETGFSLTSSGIQLRPEVIEMSGFRLSHDTALEVALLMLRTMREDREDDIKERLQIDGWF